MEANQRAFHLKKETEDGIVEGEHLFANYQVNGPRDLVSYRTGIKFYLTLVALEQNVLRSSLAND